MGHRLATVYCIGRRLKSPAHLFGKLFQVLLLSQALLGEARLADEQHLRCQTDGASEAARRSSGAASQQVPMLANSAADQPLMSGAQRMRPVYVGRHHPRVCSPALQLVAAVTGP